MFYNDDDNNDNDDNDDDDDDDDNFINVFACVYTTINLLNNQLNHYIMLKKNRKFFATFKEFLY
ncbi:hypothetical protein DERF_001434 [Dermatophagoides farinae]|uniref:Uncharacterized protein n=1 Tax=Dermatophagoides farinae TaxID=6954 RepID=A0A922IAH9_DERFA|nr:hypothetical protein DERF_001434 [Dermatophagoides farinae]